jgi:iron complex transport system ATP-binding protein
MLKIQNLAYQINGKAILHDLNLVVKSGEVLVLVGPNGAGKSTLLKLISGDLKPTSGEILLDGQPLSQYAPRKLALKRASMSQSSSMPFQFTVYEIVMMGRYPHSRHDHRNDTKIVDESLRQMEVEHLSERFFATLSGGEGARVTLARVLAQQAPLLLLDEATAALDLRHQQIVMRTARDLAREGAAVILTLHDLNLAAAYAHRIGLLHEGALYAEGTPAEVLTAPNLEAVFNLPVLVTEHPQGTHPWIIPLEPEA